MSEWMFRFAELEDKLEKHETTINELRQEIQKLHQLGTPALTEEEFTKRAIEIEKKLLKLAGKEWRGDYNRLIGYYYGMVDTHLGLLYSGHDITELNWKEKTPKIRLFVKGEK